MPIFATEQGWVLETASTGYAFGLTPSGLLAHRYWGVRLRDADDYPPALDPPFWSFHNTAHLTQEEYPCSEGIKFVEPCLSLVYGDGVRDLRLRFKAAEISAATATSPAELRIQLRDESYDLFVTLHYRAHEAYDLIERWVTISNQTSAAITLERVWSAEWHMPLGYGYHLTSVSGRHMDEMHMHHEQLYQGLKILESRRITSSHHSNPWFAIDRGNANEELGEVWFGVLAWSGNWKITAEVTDFASTRISIGLNDWDFAWRLEPGASFSTPPSLAGYSEHGFGAASRHLHDYVRDTLLPHGNTLHQVLYNSWEATWFDVDEQSQSHLAELAAEMGAELFVMDDGWFHGRLVDNAGLGDWWPDEHKFPHGLTPLIKRVNDLGMQFGLWIEPEMVNPDSELYRSHPDWVIHFLGRSRNESRQQLILNMARYDVQDYIIEKIDTLLRENNIAFIKWDMNRNVSEPGWPDAPGDPREIWVRYVEGLYHVWGTLRERHPDVFWQSCSGGGGRADYGILHYADQIWTSDNTEPTARLAIQEAFSHIFPANVMEAWVTDMGPDYLPLAFRFHVSMCGSLGVGGDLLHWGAEKRAEAAQFIALYKQIRPLVQHGDCYRLRSAQKSAFSAAQYVSKDKSEAVLFVFRAQMPLYSQLPLIYLRGLDPDSSYRIEGLEGLRSGRSWMHSGILIELKDFESTVRRIERA